ncbi:MAG: hypothetical protein ACRD3J_28845, partial [Thermoanaerobaculia bacterium]
MAAIIELTNAQWALVDDLFDSMGKSGTPPQIDRREMVNLSALGGSLAAVATLAGQWCGGAGLDPPGRARPSPTRSGPDAIHGDDRRPD